MHKIILLWISNLIKLILSEFVVAFYLVRTVKKNEKTYLNFEKRNILSIKTRDRIVIANGFNNELKTQDFILSSN
ncbi:cytochrome c-type biogenesis protein CcmH/NrfF [Flavobacterium sp. 7E]|nr:cytochrome c-type biogenesis protein CcmH/NrfF [Flavobacterium sp. 7E]